MLVLMLRMSAALNFPAHEHKLEGTALGFSEGFYPQIQVYKNGSGCLRSATLRYADMHFLMI